jgi:hypothetical protein
MFLTAPALAAGVAQRGQQRFEQRPLLVTARGRTRSRQPVIYQEFFMFLRRHAGPNISHLQPHSPTRAPPDPNAAQLVNPALHTLRDVPEGDHSLPAGQQLTICY